MSLQRGSRSRHVVDAVPLPREVIAEGFHTAGLLRLRRSHRLPERLGALALRPLATALLHLDCFLLPHSLVHFFLPSFSYSLLPSFPSSLISSLPPPSLTRGSCISFLTSRAAMRNGLSLAFVSCSCFHLFFTFNLLENVSFDGMKL